MIIKCQSSVSRMSVITQDGESALILAARRGMTEVVSLLVKAGAALDLQDQVYKHVALILSLSNAVCDSDLTRVTIAGQIEYVGVGVV